MHNILAIAKQDIRHLFSNVMSTIILIGLVVLPSLFAWYNILACWDVFGNTGNLMVAVANSDEGYESDLVPLEINVGDKVVSALRENDQIDWVFTNEDDAIEGTKSGRYYAAVVIPESFSRDMLTFYTEDMEHAKILYYVNEKKNAIAPRITGIGADTVSYQINEVFANTVSEVALTLSQSLSNYAEEGDVDGRISELSNRMHHVSDRLDQTADVLDLYASLGTESKDLISGSVNMLNSQAEVIDSAVATVDSSGATLTSLADTIRSSASSLSSSLENNQAALSDLESSLDGLFSSASGGAQSCASALRLSASDFDGPISDCSNELATLEAIRSILPEGHTLVVDAAIATKTDQLNLLQDVQNELISAAEELENGDADIQSRISSLQQKVADAKSQIDAAKSDYESSLQPGLQQLASDVEVLSGDLSQGMADLDSLGSDLPQTLDSTAQSLGTASGKVSESSADLREASQRIRELSDSLDEALASNDVEKLRELLQGNVSDLASMLSAPVEVERQAIFPSTTFGSSMSPLYSTLALFVGSLLIMVAIKPQVSKRGKEGLVNLKPRHLYFGRFGVAAFISLLQSTLLGLGNMLFLQVQVVHPLLFMVCYWFSGLVFVFIIYTLVVSFENLGKAIAVLMLIIQVTACGGSYPLDIMPDFVQWLSPYVPATHVVNAMRAAMMGVYQNDFWIYLAHLALFLIPALLLGLVLRKPMERFMRFYIRKVEDSMLVE